MRLAIIGAGNVGGALGKGWARLGHVITYGVPVPEDKKHEATAQAAGGARVTTAAKAVAEAEVVVLAVPWDAVPDALAACGDLGGRLLIDATNPLRVTDHGMELALGYDTSAGERVAALAKGAVVVKTLNQVGAGVMADATGYPVLPVMFVAGDDAPAKAVAMGLVRDLGFEPIDGGPLTIARLLEPMAMLWIDQAYARGGPPDNVFAFVGRGDRSRKTSG